jgi:hypothetical protein
LFAAYPGQLRPDLSTFDTILLTRAVLHEADQVSQKHDDRHFADGGNVNGSAFLDIGVEVLLERSQFGQIEANPRTMNGQQE